MRSFCLIVVLVCLALAACEKEDTGSYGSSVLTFSEPEVCFDTIFTNVGTSTKRLMVYNRHSGAVRTSVRLARGGQSGYRVTVDGVLLQGSLPMEVSIAGKDSMYVFVEVTVTPQQNDAPVLVTDSLIFNTNGTFQDVDLLAWGQDVHVLRDTVLLSQEWTDVKPYLLYGRVEVASGEQLTLDEGVRVYLHKGANLVVHGTLLSSGTLEHPVVIQGDRLEKRYKYYPGQWGSIILGAESSKNRLIFTEIRNGTMGLCIGEDPTLNRSAFTVPRFSPYVSLEQCKIFNMSYAGIYAYRTNLLAVNTVVANAGNYTVALWSGRGTFIHCTLANNYSPYMARSGNPVLTVGDVTALMDAPFSPLQVFFANSLIYGTMSNELELAPPCSMLDGADGSCADVRFENCLVRVSPVSAFIDNASFVDCLTNPSGFSFAKTSELNFAPDSLSVAQGAANLIWAEQYPLDINGSSRLEDGHPDIGAYELR